MTRKARSDSDALNKTAADDAPVAARFPRRGEPTGQDGTAQSSSTRDDSSKTDDQDDRNNNSSSGGSGSQSASEPKKPLAAKANATDGVLKFTIGKADVVPVSPLEKVPVPRLAHHLDRVLFNPGVYYLQDPRSHVYNFDPYLQAITPVKDFNFEALTEYMTSSRDPSLEQLARKHKLKITGSTSSMTGVLSQLHFFISRWRPVDFRRLSIPFAKKGRTFTPSQRAPPSIYLRHRDGVYAIDADKSLDDGETVLSFLGRSMEKMLTLSPEEFATLRKDAKTAAPKDTKPEAFHYSKVGSMLMRSQLDCHDPRLPGNGTFDLKTRAVLPIRMNVRNTEEGAGYQIFQSTGLLESFEREYYDMIRAAFLKYSLQVRIGHMDGIFVAFHNTERIFGFQYISLDEMDEGIHGSSDQDVGRREWILSLKLLDRLLHRAIAKYPNQSMCLTFETAENHQADLSVVVEPMEEAEIQRRQQGELLKALKAAQSNERIEKMPSSLTSNSNSKGTLESMSNTLEQMMRGGSATSTTDAEAGSEEDKDGSGLSVENRERTMFKAELTNFVNGQAVKGPPNPSSKNEWHIQVAIEDVHDPDLIQTKLKGMLERRIDALTQLRRETEDFNSSDRFMKELKRVTEESRKKAEILDGKRPKIPIIYSET
ncbi:hypothetical protein PYCC9005_002366 [Savitreella phatthalungensis]